MRIHTQRDPMFIKYQKIVRDDSGIILSGSAALLESSYLPNKDGNRTKSHSRQSVVEKLGKVIWIDKDDRNQAIFQSPTRGLVFYNLHSDEFIPVTPDDRRLCGTKFESQLARVHTNFGSPYLFFSELEKTPFMNILRKTFTDQRLYKKVIIHLGHDCLKNGSSVKCGDFLMASCLSHIADGIPFSTLNCDSAYYAALSDDSLKVAYFKAVIAEMRKSHPEFGRCCYVDSTPLPGEAENNPYNAVSSHGTDGAVMQCRLVLVLDIQTSIPLWFEIIPSNVLDKSTIMSITSDVESTLGIKIDMYDLDAGYAREELFEMFNRGNSTYVDEGGALRDHTVLVRMPASNGYPRDDLYMKSKQDFHDPDYEFDYERHTFFGQRHEISLFGHPEYAFVFIDKTQAQDLLRGWRTRHLDEWNSLSKSAKEWYKVKDGFFILTGNKEQPPEQALVEYRGRARIEGFFKDGKTFLRILPLAKWTKSTVTGKIFHDIIETTVYRAFRKQVAPADMNMSALIACMDSWECVKISDRLLEVKTPNIQVRQALEKLGYTIPAHVNLDDLRKEILEGIPMPRTPVTLRKRRKKKADNPPISPEEKLAAREQEKLAREAKKADEKAKKSKHREESRTQKKNKQADTVTDVNVQSNEEDAAAAHSRRKPGVPKGYKRGPYNKDGSPRKKPGPKGKAVAV